MKSHDHGRVVLAFDGSPCARVAARWAAAEAGARGCPLELIHASAWPLPALSTIAPRLSEEDARRTATRHLDEGVQLCREIVDGLNVDVALVCGDPAEALTKATAGASVLVLGASGQSATSQVMLGSVSAEVARRADCNVVVVRATQGATPRPSRPVVVGLDGSPGSDQVARFGLDVAARQGREVMFVHCWSDLPLPALSELMGTAIDHERAERASRVFLVEMSGRLASESHPELTVRHVGAVDRPASALLHHAEGASLLVVGRHGRAASREPLGSVSHAVLHYAPCPVAVVAAT